MPRKPQKVSVREPVSVRGPATFRSTVRSEIKSKAQPVRTSTFASAEAGKVKRASPVRWVAVRSTFTPESSVTS